MAKKKKIKSSGGANVVLKIGDTIIPLTSWSMTIDQYQAQRDLILQYIVTETFN